MAGILLAMTFGMILLGAGIALIVHRSSTPSALSTPDSPAAQPANPASTSTGIIGSTAPIDAPSLVSGQPAPSNNLPTPSVSAGKVAAPLASTKTSPGPQKAGVLIVPHPPQKPAAPPANPFGDDRN